MPGRSEQLLIPPEGRAVPVALDELISADLREPAGGLMGWAGLDPEAWLTGRPEAPGSSLSG